jgi:multimeric flavodoxin WrbA
MDTIKLLGICGSPRRNANSQFLLEAALEAAGAVAPGAVETELFSIAGKTYLPCDGCDQCHGAPRLLPPDG